VSDRCGALGDCGWRLRGVGLAHGPAVRNNGSGYFAFTNFAWLQVSYLGGSEPLALALGLGSLLAFRRDRIVFSALLASLAVTVRQLMFFVLVGIGLVLLMGKKSGNSWPRWESGWGLGFSMCCH
jgi:hypothetical protein